jgi:hypothetical protein
MSREAACGLVGDIRVPDITHATALHAASLVSSGLQVKTKGASHDL